MLDKAIEEEKMIVIIEIENFYLYTGAIRLFIIK